MLSPTGDIKIALDVLVKGSSLDWTEDNQLYNHIKAWRKRVDMLMTGMALKKELQELICQYIKAWLGEMGHTHIEAMGFKMMTLTAQEAYWTHLKVMANKVMK